MRISSKVTYALRALFDIAFHNLGAPTKVDAIVAREDIPARFLEQIFQDLKEAGIVGSKRGRTGGYFLLRSPDAVTIGDVVRAVEGPLADVRGEAPEELSYDGPAQPLERVWIATRASVRRVLEATTLAHLVDGELPAEVTALLSDDQAWSRR